MVSQDLNLTAELFFMYSHSTTSLVMAELRCPILVLAKYSKETTRHFYFNTKGWNDITTLTTGITWKGTMVNRMVDSVALSVSTLSFKSEFECCIYISNILLHKIADQPDEILCWSRNASFKEVR